MSTIGSSIAKTSSGPAGAVCAHKDGCRLVALAPGRSLRLLAAETIPAGDAAALAARTDRLELAAVVGVAPASACISRAVHVPEGDEAEMAEALSLLGEAELPSNIPPHRRSGGTLPFAAARGLAPALLLGLVDAAPPSSLPGVERWTSEVAALAHLLGPQSPALAVWADRETASVAAVGRGPDGWFARGFRAAPDQPEAWAEEVGEALAESAARAGVECTAVIPVTGSVLWLDAESRRALRERVAGMGAHDDAWLAKHGIALGAAIGLVSGRPTSRGLFDLRYTPPRQRRAPHQRVLGWLADPVRTAIVIAACIVIAAAAPLAAAVIERSVLRGRIEKIEAAIEANGGAGFMGADRTSKLYAEIARERWPMTKLIADIARALPEGAEIEYIELKTGDAVAVSGSADSLDIINSFAENLNGSGVFGGFSTSRAQSKKEEGARDIEFEMRGQCLSPYIPATGVDDFAANPLAVRMYGERGWLVVKGGEGRAGAGSSSSADGDPGDDGATDAGADDAADAEAPAVAEAAGSPSTAPPGGGRRNIFDREDEEDAAKEEPVPPPLSDADLAAMDRAAAQTAWISRQTYVNRHKATLDADTLARLEDEAQRARARVQELKGEGG